MTPQEYRFTGHDGLELFAQSWLPAEPPRAAVVLIHGLLEHSGRHARTARELLRQGYAVHAMDLRGHGRSQGPRCDVGSFEQYLLDLDIFFNHVRGQSPDTPIYLLGNSMGGLVATLWAISRQPRISGLVLSGGLLALADGVYPRLRSLGAVAAAVTPWLRVARIPLEWLASERQVVESYRNDSLMFQGRFTVRVAAEIHRAMRCVAEQAASLRVPLLVLHGSQDRVCKPAGCRALYEKAAATDKTFHLYEGFFHEVFDEPGRDRVLADLIAWLDRQTHSTCAAACREGVKT
jgi:acylglycerol lipase